MKKAIVLILTALLILAIIPAFAGNGSHNGLFVYELKRNGTAVITGFDWEANGGKDVYVPGTIDGYTVVEIGDSAFVFEGRDKGCTQVSITLPDTIVSIRDFAFFKLAILSINIPDSVQFIGKGAFSAWSFWNDPSNHLEFRFSGNHPHFAVIDNVLYNKDRKELLSSNNVKNPVIPDGIVSIGDYAFYSASFDEVTLPSTLTNIGEYAFANLSDSSGRHYKTLYVPESVTSIGQHAFEQLSIDDIFRYEGTITLGTTSITKVPDYAFNNANFSIDNPQNINMLGIETDFGNIISDPTQISSNITTIPTGFGYNKELKKLPSTVTGIDSKAFTEKVSDFELLGNLTHIADDAFPIGSTFVVESGSYAELWASENGFAYSILGQDNLDWLTGNDDGQGEEDTSWLGN